MKKLLAFIFVVLFFEFCFAQNEHFKFKEIEIDGQVIEFVDKLQKSGYSIFGIATEDGCILKGEFWGEECELIVFSTEKSKVVYGVAVNFNKTLNPQAKKY